MNYCPYCGTKTVQGASFCRSCGAPVTLEQKAPRQAQAVNDFSAHITAAKGIDPSLNAPVSVPNYKPFKYWLAWLIVFGVLVLFGLISILL